MLEILIITAEVCGAISAIVALAVLIIKPLRERVFGHKKVMEGWKCLLRADMTRTYYKYCDEGEIREYEYKNFMTNYAAYKALGGNSFIDHIYSEVVEWKILR